MTVESVSLRTVDLDNCAQEPIQIPGRIQPHGVLLAFSSDGQLTHRSRNLPAFFDDTPALGQRISRAQLWNSEPLGNALFGMLEDLGAGLDVATLSIECTLDRRPFDAVLHALPDRLVVELERRDLDAASLASFAIMAHRKMSRVRGRTSLRAALGEAVDAIRELTGFDRVMAYRFHADDSGEVVAETVVPGMDPYLGRRFPAADIPAQARRLYIVNTLRLIGDVHDEQVVVDAFDAAEAPLDMSHAILRSVSPIHVEYLKNINVAASMSVSIVIGGRLWGLIACHHRRPHRVSYAVRMACDVLAGVVASSVALALEREAGVRKSAASEVRARLIDLGADGDRSALELAPLRSAFDALIPNQLAIFARDGVLRHDGIDHRVATDLLQWLDLASGDLDLVVLDDFATLPDTLRSALLPMCGLLALRHDRNTRDWIVLLRTEQVASIVWSGPPDKIARVGPLGHRLTPDGSLAEWQQTVEGKCAPWDELDLLLARQLLDEIQRGAVLRSAEMAQARSHLLAVLGHDLRTPLQVISMSAALLQRGQDATAIAKRISSASGRMSRLVTQVLDMSRLHGGLGLGLTLALTDLSLLVTALVDDALLAYPGVALRCDIAPGVEAVVDSDRVVQALDNLLNNARQHGAVGEDIGVRLAVDGTDAAIDVSNVAAPLGEALVASLFDPLKRASVANPGNPGGLGLGLYIAHEAIKGHRGTLNYAHDGERVRFSIRLPMPAPNG